MKIQNRNKDFLICLGGGISQIPLIKVAKKKYKLIIIDINNKCPGKKFSDIFLNVSTENEKKIIQKLNKLKINNNLVQGIIIRTSGKPTMTMAKIQKKLKLNGSDPKMVSKILDKRKFNFHCSKNNILVPRLYPITVSKNNSLINFPLIIKPSISKVGKQGISIVERKENLKQAVNLSKKYSDNNSVVIQEKIEGKDVVLIGAVRNNKFHKLTIIDEINSIKNKIIKRHSYQNPSKNLNLKLKKKLIKVANTVVKVFKLNNTPLSLSFRINKKNKLYLIEINLEISGELIHEKLIKTKDSKFNSFEWYLEVLFFKKINTKPLNFINKKIFINDKILKINNARKF